MIDTIMHLDAKTHIKDMLNISKKRIDKSFPLHWHDFFEIDIVLSGSGYQNLNGTEYPLKRGVMYILRPTDFHGLYADEPIEVYNIMFHENILSDEFIYMLLNQQGNIITKLPEDIFSRVSLTADMLHEEYIGNSDFKYKYMKNLMESIFFSFMREFKIVHGEETRYDTPMKRALMYIHMHFRENPSLKTVAEAAGFCPNYFSEMFHRHVGSTYTEYLIGLKLEYAGRLLENCDITSTDVCFECGFSSVSNFLKAFKQHFGVSPRRYAGEHRAVKKNVLAEL
ncbi:MAG: helix-turn-helix domain-containing protein [Clostridia bacterium]|nr:helix-turn-helix domain-containing protein [Clostridia bacterium]